MAVLSYTVCFLSGLKSLNNKLLANNKSLPAGQFSLGRIRARLIRSAGTECTEATAFFYTVNPHITQVMPLTLHGKSLSRNRDVVFALCWEAVM